ncbi:type II and III secretion system protein family protein [Roseateles sp. DC23W]|uniref:Type II and III secretion system protein family protein n=1 Tax=Pelomonas dachongensis TaxID=3299029 RepID=A0ABW7EGN0_9BURK
MRPRDLRLWTFGLTLGLTAQLAAHAQQAAPAVPGAALPPRGGSVQEVTAPAGAERGPAAPRAPAAAPRLEVGPLQTVAVGDVTTMRYPGVSRIALGNGALVRATVVDDREIVLIGEAAGRTTLHVWLRNGRQVTHAVDVVAALPGRVNAELQAMLNGFPGVKARQIGDRLVLEGRHQDRESALKLQRLAENFPQILSLVPDQPADVDPLQLERMIQFDLRVIEVKRSALEQLGIKWASNANGPTFASNSLAYANTPWRPPEVAGYPPVNTANPIRSFLGLATTITSALQFLEQRGDAWTLAEPRLSCRSGGSATFLAGGEIPIPVPQGNGAIGVQYKEYGVRLEFKPQADPLENVDSSLMVEVSQPDTRNSNGGFIAFTTNRSQTQVRLKAGEPLVIAGLLRSRSERSDSAVPGLGRLPLIGALFGAKEMTTEKTELFIIATPRVLEPGATDPAVEQSRTLTEQQNERVERELKTPQFRMGVPTQPPTQTPADVQEQR